MGAAELLAERAREVAAEPGMEVPSPCISVCRMDPVSELCEGCFRTLDEIAAWGRMEDQGKRATWRLIAGRIADAPVFSSERKEET
ncbi:DUF1289 domain-containing protein [Ramlibacter sp. WS9]|uniref:DUF1289 domain-containing protein n=1 Tax=Ramlibacter sp. WS9 TaxID=1882741 RepID=UPI00114436B3|nr:DUF1289 domain-containing protein [Ramlibacter sp. WS9]ROZ69459.1 DUF1289 domain-containing protein [Ramlibacter sp. WS9]